MYGPAVAPLVVNTPRMAPDRNCLANLDHMLNSRRTPPFRLPVALEHLSSPQVIVLSRLLNGNDKLNHTTGKEAIVLESCTSVFSELTRVRVHKEGCSFPQFRVPNLAAQSSPCECTRK